MLPEWIDVTVLEGFSWAALVGLGLLMLLAVRLVNSVAQKLMAIVVLFGLAVGVWVYRADLDECRQTCSCSLAGLDVDFSERAEFECSQSARLGGS